MEHAFGHYGLNDIDQRIVSVTSKLPNNWIGKRLGFLLRKFVHEGRGDLPIDIKLFGYDLRLYPFDNKCEKRVVCLPQMFDPQERDILKRFAMAKEEPGFTFIDLGANAGLYSFYMSSLGLPDLKVISVEADPEMYKRFSENIIRNGLPIKANNIAVSDKNGMIKLSINKNNRGENTIETDQGIDISCKRLLTIIEDAKIEQPDAVKLDLEGAEERVLFRFFEEAYVDQFPRLILIENAPDRWGRDVYGLLEENGYSLYFKNKQNRVYLLQNDMKPLNT